MMHDFKNKEDLFSDNSSDNDEKNKYKNKKISCCKNVCFFSIRLFFLMIILLILSKFAF